MSINLQYVNDSKGKTQAVMLPVADWKRLLGKLKKYEQAFKLKADLKDAFAEVSKLRKAKRRKQTLNEFLNEL